MKVEIGTKCHSSLPRIDFDRAVVIKGCYTVMWVNLVVFRVYPLCRSVIVLIDWLLVSSRFTTWPYRFGYCRRRFCGAPLRYYSCGIQHFYRAMHFSAKRGIAIACRLSVRPSVRPSVTLVNCDHIDWNSSKIISFALCNPNMTGLLQREHPEIFARIEVGCWKSGFRRTKALISLKRGKIGPRLLLRSNRKSYTRFLLVP